MFEKIRFHFRRKSLLKNILNEAQEYANLVPDRAEDFHKSFLRLHEEIGRILSNYWPFWIRGHELLDFKSRVKNIKDMTALLPEMLSDVEVQERNVSDFLEEIESEENPSVQKFCQNKSLNWQRSLHGIGKFCARYEEIITDQSNFITIKRDFTALKKNFRHMHMAQKLLQSIGKNAETAQLEILLDAIIQCFKVKNIQDEIVQDHFDQLRVETNKLGKVEREYSDDSKILFEKVENIGLLLDDLSGWATIFKDRKRAVEKLDRYYDDSLEHPDKNRYKEDIETIHGKAKLLKDGFLKKAFQKRTEKLAGLQKKIDIYEENFGPISSVFTKKLNLFKDQIVDRHQDYKKWLRDYKSSHTSFFKISGSNVSFFDEKCTAQKQKLDSILMAILGTPMRKELAQKVKDSSHDLAQRTFYFHELDDFFKELETFKEDEKNCNRLALKVQEEFNTFHDRINRLLGRNSDLQKECLQLEFSSENIEKSVSILKNRPNKKKQLDPALTDLDSYEKKMSELEGFFTKKCYDLMILKKNDIKSARDVLSEIGEKYSNVPLKPHEGLSSTESRKLVLRFQKELQALHNTIDAQIDDFLTPHFLLQEISLKKLKARKLSVAYQAKVKGLIGKFEKRRWLDERDKVKKLRKMWLLKNDAGDILSRLFRTEDSIKNRVDQLNGIFENFNKNQYDQYCPDELLIRLNALIGGIPQDMEDWNLVKNQIDEAEHLFKALERQALHLYADEVERNVTDLMSSGQKINGTLIKDLKKELEKHGNSQPLSLPLRRKLNAAVTRNQ